MDKKSFTLDELKKRIEMRGGKLMTMADILNLPPELPESAYRRGYADGFYAGFDGYDDLLYAGVSKKNAYNRCWDFWNQELRKWRNGDCSHEVLPPQLPDLSLEDK